MRITINQLRRIIKEEVQLTLLKEELTSLPEGKSNEELCKFVLNYSKGVLEKSVKPMFGDVGQINVGFGKDGKEQQPVVYKDVQRSEDERLSRYTGFVALTVVNKPKNPDDAKKVIEICQKAGPEEFEGAIGMDLDMKFMGGGAKGKVGNQKVFVLVMKGKQNQIVVKCEVG